MTIAKPSQTLPTTGDSSKAATEDVNARLLTGGAFPASLVVQSYLPSSTSPGALMAEINAQIAAVQSGDLNGLEALLTAHVIGLNAVFSDLAVRASRASSIADKQALLQLALKAQAGARSSIQAIAEIKAPRQVAFVQQANIATHQQINTHAPARKNSRQKAPSKLKAQEITDGQTQLDTRAAPSPGRADPRDPALAPVDRPGQHGRQGQGGAQR